MSNPIDASIDILLKDPAFKKKQDERASQRDLGQLKLASVGGDVDPSDPDAVPKLANTVRAQSIADRVDVAKRAGPAAQARLDSAEKTGDATGEQPVGLTPDEKVSFIDALREQEGALDFFEKNPDAAFRASQDEGFLKGTWGYLAALAKAPGAAASTFKEGFVRDDIMLDQTDVGFQYLTALIQDEPTVELEAKLKRLGAELQAQPRDVNDFGPSAAIRSAGGISAQMLQTGKAFAGGAVVGGAEGAALGLGVGALLGPGSGVTMMSGLVQGAVVGGTTNAILDTGKREAGAFLAEAVEWTDAKGNKLDKELLIAGSLLYGVASTSLEAGSAAAGVKFLGNPAYQAVKRRLRQRILTTLKTTAGQAAVRGLVKGWIANAGVEGGQEIIQTGLSIGIEHFVKAASEDAFEDESAVSLVERLLEPEALYEMSVSGFAAASGTLILGVPVATFTSIVDVKNVQRQKEDEAFIKALSETKDNSTLLTEHPDHAREFIGSLVDGGDRDTIYVDPTKLLESFNQNDVSPESAEKVLPGINAEIAAAASENRDVAIPTKDFAATVAGSPLMDTLRAHIKTNPDGHTKQDILDKQAERRTKKDGARTALSDAASAIADIDESAERVAQSIELQLVEAGQAPAVARSNAQITGEAVRSLAAQMSTLSKVVTPEEVFAAFPFSVIDGDKIEMRPAPQTDAQLLEQPLVAAAAVRFLDPETQEEVVYEGPNHAEAFELADTEHGDAIPLDAVEELFRTDDGRLITREEAQEEFGTPNTSIKTRPEKASSEGLASEGHPIESAVTGETSRDQSRVSTRIPTSVKTEEEALAEQRLDVGIEALEQHAPDVLETNMKLMTDYVGFPSIEGEKTADTIKRFLDHAKSNLLFLFEKMDEAGYLERAKRWYEGANDLSNRWADSFGQSIEAVAAVIATQSPQTDWFINVGRAERILDVWQSAQNETLTQDMVDSALVRFVKAEDDVKLKKLISNAHERGVRRVARKKMLLAREGGAKSENDKALVEMDDEEIIASSIQEKIDDRETRREDFVEVIMRVQGRKLSELTDVHEKSVWIRTYSQGVHSPDYRTVSPEGNFGDLVRGKPRKGRKKKDGTRAPDQPGKPKGIAWGGYGAIAKAVRILEDPTIETISSEVGDQHKVRSFYNNIVDPMNVTDVTIDTHAVAAVFLRALAASRTEVKHNFGGRGASASNMAGTKGTYPFHATAYRLAAAEVGMLPRELQSITWEAIRLLMPPEDRRTKSYFDAIESAWLEYERGDLTIREAQEKVYELAGGLGTPDWLNIDDTRDAPSRAGTNDPELAGSGDGSGPRARRPRRRTGRTLGQPPVGAAGEGPGSGSTEDSGAAGTGETGVAGDNQPDGAVGDPSEAERREVSRRLGLLDDDGQPIDYEELYNGAKNSVSAQRAVYRALGMETVEPGTEINLKIYPLTEAFGDDPQEVQARLTTWLDEIGWEFKAFGPGTGPNGKAFYPNFQDQKTLSYEDRVSWIFNPEVEEGSFRDHAYTFAWRVPHEIAHGFVNPQLTEKYGGRGRRAGAMGRVVRGPFHKNDTKLTLADAMRAVEWEHETFIEQRRILDEEFGVGISDEDFRLENSINMSDAVYRALTGQFGNPGEIGVVPTAMDPELMLARAHRLLQQMAAEIGISPATRLDDETVVQEKADDAARLRELIAQEDGKVAEEPERTPEETTFLQRVMQGTGSIFTELSLAFVGTGEGAAMFGWGMYFTTGIGIARYYRGVAERTRARREGRDIEKAKEANYDGLTAGMVFPRSREQELHTAILDEVVGDFAMDLSPDDIDSYLEDSSVAYVLRAMGKRTDPLDGETLQRYADRQLEVAKKIQQAKRLARAPRFEQTDAAVQLKIAERRYDIIREFDPDRFEPYVAPDLERTGQVLEAEIPDMHLLMDYDETLANQPPDVLESIFNVLSGQDGIGNEMLAGTNIISALEGLSGEHFYKRLATILGQRAGVSELGERYKLASQYLKKAGLPGHTFFAGRVLGNVNTKDSARHQNFVIYDEADMEFLNRLEQPQEESEGARANITFTDEQAYLRIFAASDESSFGHELAHWYLQSMIVLTKRGTATPEVVAELRKIMDLLGVRSIEELGLPYADGSMFQGKPDIPHERFARMFELYMSTGKAPSKELEGVFKKYRRWIAKVYGGIKNVALRLGVTLPPEAVEIFDKMLAVDGAVDHANESISVPLFPDRESMGVTEEVYQEYVSFYLEAGDQAKLTLSKQFMSAIRKRKKDERKALREEIKLAAQEEISKDPAWQAMRWLKRGEIPDDSGMVSDTSVGLDRELVSQLYGAEAPKVIELLRDRPGQGGGRGIVGPKGKEGLDPEDVAEIFGFGSGRELIDSILSARTEAEIVSERVNREIAQSDTFSEESVQEEAIRETSGLPREVLLVAELRALKRLARESSQDRARAATDDAGAPSASVSRQRIEDAREALRAAVESGDEQSIADQTAAVEQAEAAAVAEREGRKRQRSAASRIADIEAGLDSKEIRLRARLLVGVSTVGRLTRDRTAWMSAMNKSSKLARKAIASRDYVKAAQEIEKQLLAHHAVAEANRLIKEIETGHRYAKKFLKVKNLDRLRVGGFDGAAQIVKLLERFDLRTARDPSIHGAPTDVGKKVLNIVANRQRDQATKSLLEWSKEAESRGEIAMVDPVLLNEDYVKHWRDMEAGEFLGLIDTMRNIEEISRGEVKSRKLNARVSLEEIADKISARIRFITPKRKKSKFHNPPMVEQFLSDGAGMLDAFLLRREDLIDFMGGDDIEANPLREFIYDPFQLASERELELAQEYTQKLRSLVEKQNYSKLQRWHNIPALGGRFYHHELIALALNKGNESNWRKLVEGYRQEANYQWEESDIEAALKLLDDEDWIFVQGVWDLLETLQPKIWDTHFRVTGRTPKAVEPQEFVSPTGRVMQGGYYPIVYDPSKDSTGRIQHLEEQAANVGMLGFNSLTSETEHGFTEARSEGFSRPMLLDLRALPNHVEKVIHDVSHREAVRDVFKTVHHPKVKSAIVDTWGHPYWETLALWVQAAAIQQPTYVGNMKLMGRLSDGARSNVVMVGLGYRISTALIQFTGLIPILAEVGIVPVGKAIAKETFNVGAMALARFQRNPSKTMKHAIEKSVELRHRMNANDRDIRRETLKLQGKDGVYATSRRFAFHMIGYADLIVSTIAYDAAYLKSMKEHGDVSRAKREGDRSVRRTQGAGLAKDLTEFQNQKGLVRWFSMFYSYMATLYAAQRRMYRLATGSQAQRDVDGMPLMKRDLPKAMALWAATILVQTVMAEMIQGRGPDEEDDESIPGWLVRTVGLASIAPIPGAREASQVLIGKSPSRGAIDRMLGPAERLGKDFQNIYEGDPDWERVFRDSLGVSGYFVGLPTGQLEIWVDNFWEDQRLENPRDLIWRKPQDRR